MHFQKVEKFKVLYLIKEAKDFFLLKNLKFRKTINSYFYLNFRSMKNFIILFFITLTYLNPINAQNINFGMKGGGLFSKFKFQWTENVLDNCRTDIRPIYSIFGEGKIHNNFYLGAEIGVSSFKGFIDIKYTDLGGVNGSPTYNAQVAYFGWYQQEQYYFSINPQIKLGKSKWISVGGGLGVYNNFINRFHNGYNTFQSSSSNSYLNLEGLNLYLPNTVIGGFLNLTLNSRITEHLGLILETGYIINSPSNGQISKVKPSLSFNSFAIMTGLSFHL